MKVALLVHGFASKGGKGSTDLLRPFFENAGYQVAELDYRWTGLIGVRTCNKKLAQHPTITAAYNLLGSAIPMAVLSCGRRLGWVRLLRS